MGRMIVPQDELHQLCVRVAAREVTVQDALNELHVLAIDEDVLRSDRSTGPGAPDQAVGSSVEDVWADEVVEPWDNW
jgi:hypothetical protein